MAAKKIEHQSLTAQAYNAIREGLQEGVFQPMEPLIIRTMAAEYGISATPIREALQRLVAERLLVVLPNRSIVVPRMTQKRFRELMPIRVALEGMAAELSVPNFTESSIKALEKLVVRANTAAEKRDSRTYLTLNRDFHFTIYEQAGNSELVQLISDLWLKVGPVFTGLFDDNYFQDHANDEHQNILAAIKSGDSAAVGGFMQQDIQIAARTLLPLLVETDDDH